MDGPLLVAKRLTGPGNCLPHKCRCSSCKDIELQASRDALKLALAIAKNKK